MAAALLITVAFLLMLCATLVVLLVGRDRGARREEARLHRIADDLAEQLSIEQVRVRHLQERNADLRDELDARQPGGHSLTAEWTAYLATLPVTNPGDTR